MNGFLMVAGYIPMTVLVLLFLGDKRRRKQAGERPPQEEKLLRPAGHSLSCKLEDLWERFLQLSIGSMLASLLAIGVIAIHTSDTAESSSTLSFLLFGALAAFCTAMAWTTLGKIRRHRLGLLGERSVAEQLQHLLAEGYHVFHDVPGDGEWNVDHVVVGPSGVYAIETKARTKKPGSASNTDYEAVLEGDFIQFPSYNDKGAVPQAKRNAEWLGRWLSKATGERVSGTGIVALPGWFVTLKAKSSVKVLSGKQVPVFITSEPRIFSDKVTGQIAYQLDHRCRDVAF